MTTAVAAIDCGTNSTRLLVADADGRELIRLMRITRLGQGVDRDNTLAPEAIARTVDVLHEFRRSMDDLRCRPAPHGGHVGGQGRGERSGLHRAPPRRPSEPSPRS